MGDPEGDTLTTTALSSNTALVPINGIVLTGSGAARSVTITPSAGISGLSLITILVTDGFNTVSNSFVLTVFPNSGPVFSDTFSYPDGPLATSSLATWNTHSGTANQIQVLGGKVYMSGTNSEDVSAFLGVNSFPPHSGTILYASFTANFKSRPSSTGNYFAHFRNAGNSFGCKLFSTSSGAPAGKFHLGLANSANSPSVLWPGDLDTNVTYTIVTRMNVGTGASRLWVNPASESSAAVNATDATFPFEVFTYAFREDTGTGDTVIDDFKCGTAFTNVFEASYALTITASGSDVQISWPVAAAGFKLQFTDTLPAAWTDSPDVATVEGDQNVLRYPATTGNKFFRLLKP